jgi:DNA segregation ATPase FtsK/SpoIIIE, S-DNA-T family
MTYSFTVTHVRVAFECPRLFYLGDRQGGRTQFSPIDQVGRLGQAFHELSNQFIQHMKQNPAFHQLLQPEASSLDAEAIGLQMQELFYTHLFFPYLQSVVQTQFGRVDTLQRLWQALGGLIQRWATLLVNNRRQCRATEVIAKTFLAQELKVHHTFILPNGQRQLVRGRCDSLVYDFNNDRLCVVEYKTYQSPDPSAQLAQVALYSYMLQEQIGVPINLAVYSVLPDWQELTFTWDELIHTVHQLIPHKLQQMRQWIAWEPRQPDPPPPTTQLHLCQMCPQHTKCQSFFTDAAPA